MVSVSIEEIIVKKIIEERVGIPKESITLASDFREDLACDSLDILDIVMECEKEFNISIPDYMFDNIKKVSDLVKYIKDSVQVK